jgi:chemosensory pili system protein ChpA (sensor histidine kinase/response regulator)
MVRKVDPEVLAGFIEEARSYLPQILQGIEAFCTNPGQANLLEEAYRHAHCIKGASSMVGLSGLSHIAYQLEMALEELTAGQLPCAENTATVLVSTIAQIESYLNDLQKGTLREDSHLAEVTRAYRRLRSLPVEEDEAAVQQVLGRVASAAEETAEPEKVVPKAPRTPPEGAAVVPELPRLDSACNLTLDGPTEPALAEVPAPETLEPPEAAIPLFVDGADKEVGLPPLFAEQTTSEGLPAPPEVQAETEPPSGPPGGADAEDPLLSGAPDDVSPELVEVFALEAEDHLRNISQLLPVLRQQPSNKDLLQEVRRSAHTLKGSAALVGYRKLTRLAHRMEDLLDLLYEGGREVTPEVIQLLFHSHDALEDLAAGKSVTDSVRALYAQYAQLLGDAPAAAGAASPAAAKPAIAEVSHTAEVIPEEQDFSALAALSARMSRGAEEPPAEQPAAAAQRKPGQVLRVPLERVEDLVKLFSELIISRTAFEQRMADFARLLEELQLSNERLRRASTKLEAEYEASTLATGRLEVFGDSPGIQNRLAPLTLTTHGFDALEFDRYTEFHLLSRELAETTTDIYTVGNELGSLIGDFDSYLNRQARLSSEIQDKLMRVRMVPVATLASRLHRTVRTVATQQGKQADLVLEGENTELDKTVLEEMADPLLHLLRNAVDHGIEPPALRQVKGKPAKGTIRLRAYHEGTQVVIQISDDGAGVDAQLVRASAVSSGFLSSADAAAMSEQESLGLVFLPGFSTAREVSEISGRGVGLDIVKATVHKLKGTLTLGSQPGRGTTFTIRLPTTLAVMRALLVRAGQQTLAIPLGAVTQIFRPEDGGGDRIGQEPVVRLGGRVYPRVALAKVLNFKQAAEDAVRRPPVLILNVEDQQIALVVDQLLGGRELVLKNLGNHVRQLPGIMGATLTGDGRVVLIVNPADLLREPARKAAARSPLSLAAARPDAPLTVMVVDDSPSVRRVVSNLIKNTGWKSLTAKDGLDALEVLHRAEKPPDMILLDIEMPRMDGYELLATLKGQEAYRRIPVIFITSRAGEKHRRKAMDLGASGYVVKPYQDAALLKTIRELVRESSQAVLV